MNTDYIAGQINTCHDCRGAGYVSSLSSGSGTLDRGCHRCETAGKVYFDGTCTVSLFRLVEELEAADKAALLLVVRS